MWRYTLTPIAAFAAIATSGAWAQEQSAAPEHVGSARETPALAIAAPSAPARPILWNDVEAGMTVAELRALYPASRSHVKHHPDFTEIDEYVITGKCKAEVNIHHTTGVVDKIIINGDGSMGGRCSDTVLTGLSGKYGQPLSDTKSYGSILAREGRVYVWNHDGVTLRLKRFTNGIFGGGGLASASWELTYTTVASDLAL